MAKPRRWSDAEIFELRDEARALGDRLDEVLDALLDKVTERLQELEGTVEDAAAIGALATIESLRDEHRGIGGGGAGDHPAAEPGE